ncbi:MAG: hypothetical protein ACOH5I_03250 [Oligoflexus sp.]
MSSKWSKKLVFSIITLVIVLLAIEALSPDRVFKTRSGLTGQKTSSRGQIAADSSDRALPELHFPLINAKSKAVYNLSYESQGKVFQGTDARSFIQAKLVSEIIESDSVRIVKYQLEQAKLQIATRNHVDASFLQEPFFVDYSQTGAIKNFYFAETLDESQINFISAIIKTFHFDSNNSLEKWNAQTNDAAQSRKLAYEIKYDEPDYTVLKSITDSVGRSKGHAACSIIFSRDGFIMQSYTCEDDLTIEVRGQTLGESKLSASLTLLDLELYELSIEFDHKSLAEFRKIQAIDLPSFQSSRYNLLSDRIQNKNLDDVLNQVRDINDESDMESVKSLYFQLEAFLELQPRSIPLLRDQLIASHHQSQFFKLGILALSQQRSELAAGALANILDSRINDDSFIVNVMPYIHNVALPSTELLETVKSIGESKSGQVETRALLALGSLVGNSLESDHYFKYYKYLDNGAKEETFSAKRQVFIDALGNMASPETIPTLLAIIESSSNDISSRISAIDALKSLPLQYWESYVLKYLKDSDPGMRLAVISTLAHHPLSGDTLKLVMEALALEDRASIKTQMIQVINQNKGLLSHSDKEKLTEFMKGEPEYQIRKLIESIVNT